jgi:hypothetical protein
MALEFIRVSLIAKAVDPPRVLTRSDFIDRLHTKQDDPYLKPQSDPAAPPNRIEFVELNIDDFEKKPKRWGEFAAALANHLNAIANWLDSRPAGELESIASAGVVLTLLFELWISQDQLDLVLPPGLMLTCGKHAIAIKILSNE